MATFYPLDGHSPPGCRREPARRSAVWIDGSGPHGPARGAALRRLVRHQGREALQEWLPSRSSRPVAGPGAKALHVTGLTGSVKG